MSRGRLGKNPFVRPGVVAVGMVVALAGVWLAHREITCGQKAETVRTFGDAEVRRDRVGQCYICRRDGALFDIAFSRCAAGDAAYDVS